MAQALGAGAAGADAAAAAAAAARAASIPSGAAAPFKLCKTMLTSFSAFEADPTYVLHLTVSATAQTAAAAPKAQSAASSAAAAAATSAASATTAAAAPAEPTCTIAAATSDHVVKLYEYGVHSGAITLRHQLSAHKTTIHDVQFVAGTGNTLLASASEDGSVVLWDTRTGQPAAAPFRHPTDPALPFFSCSVSGTLLAAGTTNACVLWDIRSGKMLHSLDFHTEDVTQVRFHPVQPNTLLTGSVDGTISVLDLSKITSGEDGTDDALDFTLTPDQPVSRMGFFGPRSEFLYALSTVETLTLWNLQNADLISDFKDIRQTLSAASGSDITYLVDCVYEPASQRLYLGAGTVTGALLLTHVNKSSLQPVCRLEGAHKEIVRDLLWIGQTLVTGGQDSKICSWTTAGDTAPAAAAAAAAATAAPATARAGATDFKAAGAGAFPLLGAGAAAVGGTPSKGLVFSTPILSGAEARAAAAGEAPAPAAMEDTGLGAVRTKSKPKDKKFNPYAR